MPLLSDEEIGLQADKKLLSDEEIGLADAPPAPPVQKPPDDEMARAKAALTAVTQGITFGTSDELIAGLNSGFGLLGDYDQELATTREHYRKAREQFPVTFLAGEVGGGLAGGVGLIKSGLTLAGRVATPLWKLVTGGAEGATLAGIYGFGTGENIEDRLAQAGEFAKFGGPLGIAGEVGVMVVNALRGAAGAAASARARGVVGEASQFDIPVSRGQATGDVTQQAFEQAASADAQGAMAGRRAREFFDRQRGAVTEAGEQLATQAGGGRRIVESPQQAADVVSDAIRRRGAELRTAAEGAYKMAERGNATIAANAVKDLRVRVTAALADEIIPDNFTTVSGAMNKIAELASLKNAPPNTIGIHWKEVERVRRTIIAQRGSTPDESRILRKIKESFDGWFGDAVDNALFSGDPRTIDALKEARGLWAEYKSLTAKKSGDPASRLLFKIAAEDATANEVANALFGVAQVGAKAESVKLARLLKNEFGADSEAMNAVRQAVILKIMERTRGTGKKGYDALATQIDEFLGRSGRDWSEIVFTTDQRNALEKFSNVVRRLPADQRIMNPSGSGYAAMRMAFDAARGLFTILGFNVAGLPGAAAGATIPAIGAARSAMRANRAFSAPVPPARLPTGAAPTAIGGTAIIDERRR